MKTIIFLIGMLFIVGSGKSQISNPYNSPIPIDCWALNQNSFNLNPNIFKHFSCFELPGNGSVSVTGIREVELSAGKEVHLKPGFSVSNLSGNGNFHALIEKEDVGVAVFTPITSLGEVPKCEKLELGLNLPDVLTDQIENYFNDIPHDAINPFDPDQISIEANFIHYNNESLNYYEQNILPLAVRNTSTIRQSFGFYYEEFHTDYSVYSDGNWIQDTTSFNFRIRFSPNETGVWRTEIKIFVRGQLLYTLKPIYFRCTPSNCPGFIVGGETTNDNRHFVFENGDAFFGIGQNIAWADKPNSTMPPGYGPTRAQAPEGFKEQRGYIEDLGENGGNLVRIHSAEWTDALEWEKLGDYKQAMPFAWEFDRTFDLLEEKNIYTLWCMQTHTAFMYENPFSSDDSQAWPGNPYNTELGLPSLESFFTDAQALSIYKKKIRYMMARWGHSSQIAGLQPFSEINEIADNDDNLDPYSTNTIFREDVNEWILGVKNYIQDDLKYNFNIGTSFTSDLTGFGDNNNLMATADFNDWHPYSDGRNRNIDFRFNGFNVAQYNKPIIIGEIGLLSYELYECSENDWHNDLWASSMIGGWATGLPWYLWKGEHNTRENFNFLHYFFDTYIDFKNIDWVPQRWPEEFEDPQTDSPFTDYSYQRDDYYEVLYMVGDLDFQNYKRAFGWVHNRSSYWYNKKLSCENNLIQILNSNSDPDDDIIEPEDDDDFNITHLQYGPINDDNRIIRLKDLSNLQQYDIDWFNPTDGTHLGTTDDTNFGFGRLQIQLPDVISTHRDIVFLLRPKGSSFFNPLVSNSESNIESSELSKENNSAIGTASKKSESFNSINIIIFPNPSKGIFTIKTMDKLSNIEIYDVLGKIIYSTKEISSEFLIDLSNNPNGIYFIRINTQTNSYYDKIVLQR